MRLLLVYPGQDYNAADLADPARFPGLTAEGVRQAHTVAERLALETTGLTTIYATPNPRTVETAEVIAGRLDITTTTGLAARIEGEGWPHWVSRVGDDIEALAARHRHGTVVLSCEADVILAIEQHLTRGPYSTEFVTHIMDFASITEWIRIDEHGPADGRGRWARLRHNDIAHRILDPVAT